MQKQFKTEWAGRPLIIGTGKLAGQTHGSCTVQYGDTMILATVVQGINPREGVDYFPLMVDYEEKLYAAGKIKGSRFIKREGRATDEAVLTGRLIDRSIRPLFKETERKDVQVVITVLSIDGENDPDIPALIGASCALNISSVSWNGPISCVRMGRIEGEWVVNPSNEAKTKSELDLFLVGTKDEVVMIEADGNQVEDKIMFEAIEFGHKHMKKLFPFLQEVKESVGREKKIDADLLDEEKEIRALLDKKVKEFLSNIEFNKLFPYQSKDDFKDKLKEINTKLEKVLKDDSEVTKEMRAQGLAQIDDYVNEAARDYVMKESKRVDGRGLDEVRELGVDVGLLPRTHGSGLFSRGETQVLSVVTLGSPGAEQILDTMELEGKKRYMHHYNFPGFSVGEVKPNRGPGRREIGHGALAEKALESVIPGKEEFPYTIRVVSEVLSSNGSSSQASVCGSTLALMDAGVPIANPVAGIAMGMFSNSEDKNDYKILTDIQGIEDHFGDMDFKVAGTEQGITAIQLDIKLGGIGLQVCQEAIVKAREARLVILKKMQEIIAEPRQEMSPYAPRIESFNIHPDKIREVIGAGGKVINQIIDQTGVDIDIEDDGLVVVTGVKEAGVKEAVEWIKNIIREVQAGEEFDGKVTRLMDFGAFVEVLPGKEGLVHISELDWKRTEKVEDVVKVGDSMRVKVIEIDDQGRINLSRKALMTKPEGYEERPPRRDNNHRSNNHRSNNRNNHRR